MELFEFTIDILDYSPGEHSVLVMVVDIDSRVAADSIPFTTPPQPRVTCGVERNILTCDSNNPIAILVCRFDNGPPTPCSTTPLDLVELGLPLGPHSLDITITDIYDRSLTIPVGFSIVSDLELICSEVVDERVYITGLDCSASQGIGDVSYACSYDGSPPEDCEQTLVLV